MNSNKIPYREILILAVGELAVGCILCLVFFLCGKFDYKVATGALLGGTVTVLNFLFLCIFVNRAIDKCLSGFDPTSAEIADTKVPSESDGAENTADDTEDAAAKFAKENAGKLQNAVKLSYVIRTASVIIALILALLTKQFNVIATVIPLLCLRPLLNAAEIFRRKGVK